ncbi:uncharacterized protein LOC120475065 isoform X1 [Pimephales promelas]|uniref:uncharacterized protein LOC120475065 isoform X1 n=1 Tax=Pimephales promelas TaxID=90988 RepID=UPI0019558FA9|nr:uncharacterized protein LOC120475065 isoform X1 [Pimephales promelas]XP_039521712.1 uncharacterized protein LOC120475065 isoform X1 [Pimephales promelas]
MMQTVETKTFCGVIFLDEDITEVVPRSWVKGDECFWPTFISEEKTQKAIKRHEMPGPGWKIFKIRTLFEKVDDFSKARQKLKDYNRNGTTVLQSEDESSMTKRRRKVTHYPGFENGSTDSETEKTPKRRPDSRPRPRPRPQPLAISATLPSLPPAPLLDIAVDMGQESLDNTGQETFTDISWNVRRESDPFNAAQLHGLLLLENLKQQVAQLATTVNLLMAKVNNGLQPAAFEWSGEFHFPLESDAELDRFETWLADPANDRQKHALVNTLSAVGGVDLKRVTWNILSYMFSCPLSRTINWKGVNKKRAFHRMASRTLLSRAVRKCALTTTATEAEIWRHAIRWFALSADRSGGRQERLARQQQEQQLQLPLHPHIDFV